MGRCCRNPAQFPHIGVHDIRMRLQELLNFLPAQGFLVHLSIAHCITRMDGIHERCFDGGEHEFDEHGGLACIVAGIDGIVVFLLMVVDDGLDWQPCKHRIPFGEQQCMPEPSNAAIAVCKGMDQLQLIVEHAASDQHVQVAVLCPIQQLHDQTRNILRQRAEMQNMPLLIYNANRPRAEHAGLLYKPASHDTVSGQQVVHGVRVKLVQPLVNLIGILDLGNILGRSQYLLTVENSRDLFQCQRVLLNGQRTVNCTDAIGAPQGRIGR